MVFMLLLAGSQTFARQVSSSGENYDLLWESCESASQNIFLSLNATQPM